MYYFYSHINFQNKYYDELKSLPAPIREMTIFKKIVSELPLEIRDNDLIPGRYGSTVRPGPMPPVKEFEYISAYSPEELRVKNALVKSYGIEPCFEAGHTCLDYGYIIENGIRAYEKKVLDELEKNVISEEKKTMLEAMLLSVECVKIYMERFSELASKKYRETGNKHFLTMQKAISKVPYEPAESFYEAIVSIWTMHSLSPLADGSWASISLGRMDQYLYPIYKRDKAKGVSEEEMMSCLESLFELLNLYGDGACALNIGGLDKDGNDMTNELSYLLLKVERKVCSASPILALRVNPNTPEKLIDECIDQKFFTIGQPTFYGEIPCRNAVAERGIPTEKSWNYAVNSCMGLFMVSEEIASMWGCKFNMHLALELAINGGKPLFGELPINIDIKAETEKITDIDELLRVYEKYLRKLCVVAFDFNRKNAQNMAANRPNAFLSMMTEGCIENGLDRAKGAKYNTETIEAMATANTANAICAINTLIFKEKKYTLEEYIKAAQNDFEGYDEILRDIKRCEKVHAVAEMLARFYGCLCRHLLEKRLCGGRQQRGKILD